jgi:hypothetical protein
LSQCSFCGRSEEQVKKLIAGASALICDQCVSLCGEILAADGRLSPDVKPSADVGGSETGERPPGKAWWSGYDPLPPDS